MAAFNSSYNRPQFQPRANNGSNRKRTFDRPITVTGYDLAKKQIFGEHKGVKYAFYVKPDVFARIELAMAKNAETNKANGKDQAPYLGHSIDAKMQTAIPVNSKAIVIASEGDGTSEGDVKFASIDRVKRIDKKKSKLVEDRIVCVTAKTVKGQIMVSHFLVFEDKGIDINDLEALEKLAQRLDESSSCYGTTMGPTNIKVVRPSVGIRLITYVPTLEVDEYTKDKIGHVINRTYCYDFIPDVDENGNPIRGQGHLLTGAEMMSIREEYMNFVNNDEELNAFREQAKSINPDWDLKINIQEFNSYPASGNDNNTISVGSMGTPEYEEKNKYIYMRPLYQLSHAKSYLDLTNEELLVGTNAAVRGTLEVSADKPIEDGDGGYLPGKVPNNWGKCLYTNGTRGDSLSMIRAADGTKLVPHPKLAIIRDDNGVPSARVTPSAPATQPAAQSSAPAYTPSRPTASVAAPAPAPVSQPAAQSTVDDFDFDIFGDKEEESPAPSTTRAPTRFSSRRTGG